MTSRSLILTLLLILTGGSLSAQSWQYVAPMTQARADGRSVTLADGRMLMIGGYDNQSVLNSCEIFDPKTDSWSVTGSMNEPRQRFGACLLLDGRVLVVGGLTALDNGSTVPTSNGCEIYDPTKGTWSQLPAMDERRETMPLLLLPSGKVFISGGLDGSTGRTSNSAVLLDPQTGMYTKLAPMLYAVWAQICFYDSIHNQIIVQGGGLGGLNGGYPASSQVYDIATNTWHPGPSSSVEHNTIDALISPEGSLYCLGGRPGAYEATDLIECLSPPYDRWRTLGRLTSPRWLGIPVLVSTNSILYIGGNNNPGYNTNVFDSTNWFNYKTAITTQGPRLQNARFVFTTLSVHSTDSTHPCQQKFIVYVFGGLSKSKQVLRTCEKLEINSSDPASEVKLPANFTITATPCSFIDTTLIISNDGCDSVVITSVTFTGSDAKVFTSSDSVLVIQEGKKGEVRIIVSPQGSGIYTARLNLTEIKHGHSFDTAIPFFLNVSKETPFTVKAILKDVSDVKSGDTIEMPVYLICNLNNINACKIDFSYNTNVMKLMDPNLINTLLVGSPVVDLKEREGRASLNIPLPFSNSSSMPLIRLRFRALLSDTMSTTIRIDNLTLSANELTSNSCISFLSDTGLVTFVSACGDGVLKSFIRTNSLQLQKIVSHQNGISLYVSQPVTSAYIEVFDLLGRLVTEEIANEINDRRIDWTLRALRSGEYFIRIHIDGKTFSSAFKGIVYEPQ